MSSDCSWLLDRFIANLWQLLLLLNRRQLHVNSGQLCLWPKLHNWQYVSVCVWVCVQQVTHSHSAHQCSGKTGNCRHNLSAFVARCCCDKSNWYITMRDTQTDTQTDSRVWLYLPSNENNTLWFPATPTVVSFACLDFPLVPLTWRMRNFTWTRCVCVMLCGIWAIACVISPTGG